MDELKPFYNYEAIEKTEDVFLFRLRCQDAKKELNEIIAKIDEELIRRMKKENRVSFEIALANGTSKITYEKKKTEKITDTRRLKEMLLRGSDAEKALAEKVLAGSQSAWKMAQVKVLCDTLGITDLIETTFNEEIELKIIPVEMIEQRKAV